VSLIANVLEPERGIVLDPACGSGGMFVQSAHFVERLQASPSERLTFFGLEKNPTTIRLAKMNLAVHGLEGNIQKAITYYEDPHELLGKADFVLANPPFNVDEVDADKVKRDPRLPFGLPGVNKAGKVSNGNYLWISYFYSYLNEKGRSGFVMSSQASSAGRDEAKVRQKLIETGDVDIMISIRSNFFYTRTVPCELWFLNRNKPKAHRDRVLMLDARNIYRKVTRKIYDFSPEQLQNLLAIIWLYRGEGDRFLDLVARYIGQSLHEARACFETADREVGAIHALPDYQTALTDLRRVMQPFLETVSADATHAEVRRQLEEACKTLNIDAEAFKSAIEAERKQWQKQAKDNAGLNGMVKRLLPLAERSRDLIKQSDLLYKLACRLIDICEGELAAKESELWISRDVNKARKAVDEARQVSVDQFKQVRYFHKQAVWLIERFPMAALRDVEGLVRLVDRTELEVNDWSLTPGRYVGVAQEEKDDGFDFEEALRDIHIELEGLNAEAVELAAKIKKNFEELGI
jgi:type I restriction enzyme M protein